MTDNLTDNLTETLADPSRPPLDSGRILIVDDHPTNIDVLFDYLSDLGYEVLVAEDGQSALERIHYARPDIILLDIMMPTMDGFDTCEQLKANPETRDIPVIYVTALGGISDKIRGFEAGAVDYITKPYQNQEVLARVRTHLTLRRLQAELAERLEESREQNEALDAYAHTVAHDLKNPLNLITNFGRLILEDPGLSDQSVEDLEHVLQSADKMNHIIQDLLLLAQVRKEAAVQTVGLNMKETLRSALNRLKCDLDQHGAVLTVPEVWPNVKGQTAWIEAVWVNYISNALKYGGRPPMIDVLCKPDDVPGFFRFGVKDNGGGIPAEEQGRVFDEFSRIGQHPVEGHGVGLSIVRRILKRLEGRVGVENNADGPGCTFYFTLPEAENL
ncbi:MAG: hybrid sensor histidine kinase/response regulator [Verrucomicrobia bacterium]|nr:hybrid sensor histidine kinase/response regulator [Verrucomicrobiota bacterium]MCH8529111.1 hybrid sensor histidine kinase/response regulator [Kiritimatiellia bacterium]